MDPHLLRTFVTVARCGSFSAAARQLRYTQSAVSQQIAALEEQLGTPLLTRRPVRPTVAGADLARAAGVERLRAAVGYPGCDLTGLLHLLGAGAGLAVLPSAVSLLAELTGVPLSRPRLVHRIELLHGHLPTGPARALAAGLGGGSPTSG